MATEAVHRVDSIRRIPAPEAPVPFVALPTLGLLVGGYAVWVGSVAMALSGTWPWIISILVNAVAQFALFTVSHDAAHNAISTQAGITRWIGRLATIMFAPHAGFRTWRFIHMQHHRFTNEDDGRDPDAYTHDGPKWALPLRWATVDLWYMVFYLPGLRKRPRGERIELLTTWAVVAAVIVACALTGHIGAFLLLYLLPQRLAITFLAWTFDYLPHTGLEHSTAATDRFGATRNRVGHERLLSPALLNQNYHLVHHLHPVIPFYKYVSVWRRSEEHYLANAPALATVGGRELTVDEYRALRGMAEEHHS